MRSIAESDLGTPARVSARLVTLTIDDHEISVPKGTLVIRAAELMGVQIPRFCDHPLLDPVGACRQCLVDVEGQRKPLASCTTAVASLRCTTAKGAGAACSASSPRMDRSSGKSSVMLKACRG